MLDSTEPQNNEAAGLTQLGSRVTEYPTQPSSDILETFANRYPDSLYTIVLKCPEFTSRCPKTHQPDFANITVTYSPDKKCVETKSLKLYLGSYRDTGQFMEAITNRILTDLCFVCQPKWMKVDALFNARGGIVIEVCAEYNSNIDTLDFEKRQINSTNRILD